MNVRHKNIEYGFEVEPRGTTFPLFKQVHGSHLVERDSSAGKEEEADGAFTFRQHFTLSVFTADCIPLLFFTEDPYDPIAAIHCGWKGAKDHIALKTMDKLFSKTKTHVAIGPAILKCCFEVRDDLVQAFKTGDQKIDPFLEKRGGKIFFDLLQFVKDTQLKRVESFHEELVRCTHCSKPTLPSYRRDHDTNPNIRSWIRKL